MALDITVVRISLSGFKAGFFWSIILELTFCSEIFLLGFTTFFSGRSFERSRSFVLSFFDFFSKRGVKSFFLDFFSPKIFAFSMTLMTCFEGGGAGSLLSKIKRSERVEMRAICPRSEIVRNMRGWESEVDPFEILFIVNILAYSRPLEKAFFSLSWLLPKELPESSKERLFNWGASWNFNRL